MMTTVFRPRLPSPYIYGVEGFSLIELSIIITMFSLLMAGILGSQTLNREVTRITAEGTNLTALQKSIQAFYQKNKYLPCPASRTQAPDTATYGTSTDCSLTTAPAGTVHVGTAADDYQLRIGAVPTRTLGIADRLGIDPWGNRITYALMRKLGVDAATYTAYAPTATTGYFQIVDGTGAATYGSSTTTIVAYALITHGSDGKGAYTKQGAAGIACSTTSLDKENCNADKKFMDAPVNETQGATYFDDFIRWVKKSDLDAL